jgi:hypothetical protein
MGAALLVVAGILVAAWPSTTGAAEERTVALRYLSVSGDGPTAKVWFDGAPSAGMRVQEALDRFAKDGFRVAHVTPAARPSVVVVDAGAGSPKDVTAGEQFYVMILEKRTP